MKKILFVCSGNTCRSPMAEGVAGKIFTERLKFPVKVASAGSSAFEGQPASADAIRVASNHGIDITAHQSRLLNLQVVKDADLIVTMGNKHRDTVGIIEPEALDYTVLLTDFCGGGGDVPDPIGGGVAVYEDAFALIKKCVEQMAGRLDDYDGWKTGGHD